MIALCSLERTKFDTESDEVTVVNKIDAVGCSPQARDDADSVDQVVDTCVLLQSSACTKLGLHSARINARQTQ